MNLKKINKSLQKRLEELGFDQPSVSLKDSFGSVKSGQDVVVFSANSSMRAHDIVIHAIQKAEKAFLQSPRILIIAKDKETVIEIFDILQTLTKYMDLRAYYVHDKSNLDEDKNLISVGIDILIGTPNRLNEMFSGAGFDVNQLKMLMVYELDELLRQRYDAILYRLSESIGKTQRVFYIEEETEKVGVFVEKTTLEAIWIEDNSDI